MSTTSRTVPGSARGGSTGRRRRPLVDDVGQEGEPAQPVGERVMGDDDQGQVARVQPGHQHRPPERAIDGQSLGEQARGQSDQRVLVPRRGALDLGQVV